MLLRFILVAAALSAFAAAPAAAQDTLPPSLAPLKRCYVVASETQREYVPIQGEHFTAFAPIDIFVDDTVQHYPEDFPPGTLAAPQAAFDGKLVGSVFAPFIEDGQRQFAVRVSEHDTPANSVIVTSKVTRLSLAQSPKQAATRATVRFRGRGFTAPKVVYAHYVFAGKSRKTVRIGMPTGDCGTFSVRKRQFPFKSIPQRGTWTIWFDQEKAYNPKASLRVPLIVKVTKAIKPERAPAR